MPKGHIITGLDIGTSAIKILVVAKKSNKEELEVLALIEEPTFGIRKGVVIDVDAVSETLKTVLNKACEDTKQKIDSVYVNIGGAHIFSTASHGLVSVSRADRKISQEDIERVLQEAKTISLPSNKEILEVFPKEFIVDGERGLKEVLGMEGVRLEVDVVAVGVFSPYLKNLTEVVLGADVQIDDLMPSPLASARAVLRKREKELGVVLLDIGAGTTGIAVFEESNLIHATVLPMGSAHITNDIAIGLKIDTELAEKIKLEFGTCLFRGNDKREKVELEENEKLVFSHKQVAGIIESRVSEIFDEVNKELKKIQKQAQLPGGVVLTGGGAKLPKILELAKKELKLSCRIGRPQGFSPDQDDTSLATVCGLVLGGADLEGGEVGGLSWRPSFGKGVGAKIKKLFKIFLP